MLGISSFRTKNRKTDNFDDFTMASLMDDFATTRKYYMPDVVVIFA